MVCDLDEAISLHRSALDVRPAGHSDRSDSLYSLALCFNDRYNKQGTIADLEEAITFGRAALELHSSGHSHRALTLFNLAISLRDRFLKLDTDCDLDEAILLHQSVLDLRPVGHSDRSSSLHSLALCFSDRYNEHHTITDLEEAITLGRVALELHSPGHSCRVFTLDNLAIYLRERFLTLDMDCDLNEAISLHRSALDLCPAGHSDRSDLLHSLALCFSDRYNKQSAIEDLEEAITLGRAALELRSPGHSCRVFTLNHLAIFLKDRFLKLDTGCDLSEAIALHRSVLDLHPAGHSDWLRSLNQLANCLSPRFEKLDAAADLDELISLHRAILDFHPQGHHDHAKSINKLLLLVRKRIQRHDMAADLDECISLGRSALASCEAGNPGRATYLHDLVTDLRSRFRKLENISDVQEAHPDNAVSLHKLLIYVKDLIDDGDVTPVVDGIVAIARVALKLCPTGRPDHVMSLTTLAAFLLRRFQQQGAIVDSDEAITLYQAVLEVCQSGNLASAPHLHDLAQCLSERFTRLAMSTDLDDAIKFEQVALALRPQGHPDHAESLSSLFNYRQLKMKGRGASTQSARPTDTTSGSRFKCLIGDIVLDVLEGFPPRLLDICTGKLCDRDSQVAQFEKSGEYNQLLSSASAMDALAQVTRIREVVSAYFRYVTLSHRWGKFEPLLRDIDGRVVYDLDPTDGISKLQFFCQECCRHGYLWAWSDTCCIDKESSTELQEAIGSMFSCSVWFKRGWTLQELLAPHTMLFFTRDWSLYRGSSSNHKEDSAILSELEQATGIISRHLTDFHPSVDDARSRLQWASTRCTTRPEDIAYSLLGVFSLHIPVLYGESAENALGRLLAEVISKSGDTSILDWVGRSSAFHSCFPATIIPYQTLPLSLPDLTTLLSTGRIRQLFFLRTVRKMHQALSNLPLAKFANFRLILPCIVHRIKTMTLTRVDTSTATHVHQIQAVGLAPIDIALSERLENTVKKVPYILIRPWHPNLLHPAVDTDDAWTHQWLTRLEQPFSALLLKELPHHEYRRVASFCHIIARPTDSAGMLKGEVNTLTIV
ncbi:hypothetical protein SCLCIDRAFT_197886 [Scleroderma citrinum Foug A]|uniref:Heterokaryon incompatibility domain-containing protein n=1 Tax=Scleroderma citrinum Foug A TaxID=1036808 RepID=A0A0C3DLE5_9AGAM|nr:hypothetical protein SCLCIDRAFT_197886 [Scleroderma citrinum Foug A]